MSAEYFARECRKALRQAWLAECAGQIELADAAGQVAANKLAQAIRLDERDNVINITINVRPEAA